MRKLDDYGGVIIADVVGLGKSIVGAPFEELRACVREVALTYGGDFFKAKQARARKLEIVAAIQRVAWGENEFHARIKKFPCAHKTNSMRA